MAGSWTSWVLTDQAAMDTAAEALLGQGFYSTVTRGHDTASPPNIVRSMQINIPGDDLNPQFASIGQAVVLMGGMILVLTSDQYQASPFFEE